MNNAVQHARRLLLAAMIIQFITLTVASSVAYAEATLKTPFARDETKVTPWGNLQVIRTIRVTNTGSDTISSMTVLLPREASAVVARDDLEQIASTVTANDSVKSVEVTLRYPLRGNVSGVVYNDVYTFSLHYELASNPYITQVGFGNFRLELNVSSGIGTTINNYSVTVILPEGATFSSSEPVGLTGATGISPTVSFLFTDLQPSDNVPIVINYGFLQIWSIFRPALFVGAIVAVVSISIYIGRSSKKNAIPETSADARILRSLTQALDEELGLWEDLDQIEEGLDEGSIGRKDYNRRRRILDDRSRGLSEELSRLKDEARDLSPKYEELMDKLVSAEKEFIDLRGLFNRTRAQFRAGRLPRRTFEDQAENFRRRSQKIRASVESILIELRGEVS